MRRSLKETLQQQQESNGSDPTQLEQDMNNIGLNVAGVGASEMRKLHEKRMKKGLCPTCEVKCYKVTGNILGKKKRIPLTIAGHVKDGVCLTCNPNNNGPSFQQPPPPPPPPGFQVPKYIEDDNQTMVSGITLDRGLYAFPSEDFNHETAESRWKHESPVQVRKPTASGLLLDPYHHQNQNQHHHHQHRHRQLSPPQRSPPASRPEPSFTSMTDADDRPVLPTRQTSDHVSSHCEPPAPSALGPSPPTRSYSGYAAAAAAERSDFEMALVEEEKLEEMDVEDAKPSANNYPPSFPEEEVVEESSSHDDNKEFFFDPNQQKVEMQMCKNGDVEDEEDSFVEVTPLPRRRMPQLIDASPDSSSSSKLYNTSSNVGPPPLSSTRDGKKHAAATSSRSDNSNQNHSHHHPPRPPPIRKPTSSDHTSDRAPPHPRRIRDDNNLQHHQHVHYQQQHQSIATTSKGSVESLASPVPTKQPMIRQESPGSDVPRLPVRRHSDRIVLPLSSLSTDSNNNNDDDDYDDGGPDVSALLQSLQKGTADRVATLEQLTATLVDVDAKRSFCASDGVGIVNATMWLDMSDSPVQQECAGLLVSLVAKASPDEPDFLTGETGQNVIDTLLIVMRGLLHDAELQQRGCRVLACLARATANNDNVSDGSTTGAVLTILNAMDTHRNSKEVMEWGVRTLYEFCAHSRYADTNKRNMWSEPLDNGIPGWSLLIESLEMVPEDAVGLLWVLSSNQDALDKFKPADDIVAQLVRLLKMYQKDRLSSLLVEATLGCIANFASAEENLKQVDPTDISVLVLSLIPQHVRTSPQLCTEACAVVSRLAPHVNKTTLVEQGGIDDLALAMEESHGDEGLHEEAVKTLLKMLRNSAPVKEAVAVSETFNTLMKLFRNYEISPHWQTLACQLFASLFAFQDNFPNDLERDGLGAVCFAMTLHAQVEKVQESACIALGNLSGRPQSNEVLLESEAVDLGLSAMNEFPQNLMIQIQVCMTLWNLEYRSSGQDEEVDIIKCIVIAIQNHIESEQLLEVACGALLTLIYGSDTHKIRVAQNGGVEALTCALVMHCQTTNILEKVCEVLASLSACRNLANPIIDAQCVGNVVEAVRSNDSISVLKPAALFLKNIVVAEPRSCEEATGAITTIVKAMQKHRGDSNLQREACNYLWSVGALSEDGRGKILALDGVSVLMETLEAYRDSADVQQAALGAFQELALSA